MKFQLFGRLRDDESGGTDQQREAPQGAPGQEETPQALGGGSLERTVDNLFSQGYAEEEIRQELQGQYSQTEIDRAINNAVASTATPDTGPGPKPMTPYQSEEDAVSPVDEGFSQNDDTMDQREQEPQQPNPQPAPPAPQEQTPQEPQEEQGAHGSNVEELVETIVAENFDRVEREFENVYREIDELKDTAEDLEQRVHDLEVRDDEDQTQFIQKMDEMEEHIDSYQSRIGGLEKAFQQVLPSLVDNVRDLTDLVQDIKQERGIETDKNVSSQDIDDIDVEDWN